MMLIGIGQLFIRALKPRPLYALYAAFMTLCSCMVGPEYHPPSQTLPDTWHTEDVNCTQPDCTWWEQFQDPLLNQYLYLASQNNLDLIQARATICAARGQLIVEKSELYPHINADFNALRTYFSKNGPVGIFENRDNLPSSINLYNAIFDASWEIDFFGKIRHSVMAAKAEIESTIEEKNATLLMVLAEVAKNYFELRSTQKRIEYTQKKVSLFEELQTISSKQNESGYTDLINLNKTQSSLEQAYAELPELFSRAAQNIYALSVLTGNLPETFIEELTCIHPLPQPIYDVKMGLRSELLRRRPDIISAEKQLAKATANIGVAVASFFPSFKFIGFSGLQSLHFPTLFQANSFAWAAVGNAHIPIFQGGKLIGNLKASQSEEIRAIANYQQTVLKAVEETENALISYKNDLVKLAHTQQSSESLNHISQLTAEQYMHGYVDKISQINNEEEYLSSQLSLIEVQEKALIDLVVLYKALAGSFNPC
jgi:outer membrane protein, multidrug efflux system